jgi:hypothetical protein
MDPPTKPATDLAIIEAARKGAAVIYVRDPAGTTDAVLLVDADDYDRVMAERPYIQVRGIRQHVPHPVLRTETGSGRQGFRYVSHFVIGLPAPGRLRHRNGDLFDCRKANLERAVRTPRR